MEGPIYNAAYLARHMDGYETLVVGGSPLKHETSSASVFTNLGVNIFEIPEMGKAISPLNDWRTIQKMKQVIRDFKPDIVHSHCFSMDGIPARIAATQEHIPVKIHTFHGHVFSNAFDLKTQILKRIEQRLSQKWDAIIAISPSQKIELVETYKISEEEKTHVIPLGIDLNRFNKTQNRKSIRNNYGFADDEIVVGIVARLSPVKNHRLFIDAIAELKLNQPNIRALIIGDGALKDELIQYARQKNVYSDKSNSTILFTSWINHIEEILPALDVFALTSHSEGTPVSIIEAQASGLPIVAADVGGVKDCMVHNHTGFLVPPSDVKALCEVIETLINSPEQRIAFGQNGHHYAHANFHYLHLVSRVKRLYASLLQTTV